MASWPQLSLDVQRDDQESCGLQGKSQWLHGWSAARIRGRSLNYDCIRLKPYFSSYWHSFWHHFIYRTLIWIRKKRTQKLTRTDWRQRVPSWSDRHSVILQTSLLSLWMVGPSLGFIWRETLLLVQMSEKNPTGVSVYFCPIVSVSFANVLLSMGRCGFHLDFHSSQRRTLSQWTTILFIYCTATVRHI